ncbi:histone-fold-containing protein [Aspergillus pseudoustus]|uniref:DNA polymerase epsilon subunit D n=1 Tax=Aspergillus pseudoustus TaxID=1810923 RepID=A0ABR4J715_9EURO
MSSPSPDDPTESQAPSQPQPPSTSTSESTVQATEQQLKARAEGVSIEDYLLPRSLTLRLAKSVLPPNTSVQKDAVLAIQQAATVFVSYLSSHANESTLKRTVTPADVLNALSELEFEGFRPRLEKELDKFTDLKAAKRKPRKSTDGGDQNVDGTKNAEGEATKQGEDGNRDTDVKTAEQNPNVKEVVVRGAKRVKKGDGGGGGTSGVGRDDEDENEDEDMDDGEGEGEEHDADADATEEEEEEEEEEDEDEDDEAGEGGVDDDDNDRVEDLDRDPRSRRMVDPDAGDDTESDSENGPGSQLRGTLGLG